MDKAMVPLSLQDIEDLLAAIQDRHTVIMESLPEEDDRLGRLILDLLKAKRGLLRSEKK